MYGILLRRLRRVSQMLCKLKETFDCAGTGLGGGDEIMKHSIQLMIGLGLIERPDVSLNEWTWCIWPAITLGAVLDGGG
jgi:hypothetical protein